MGKKNIGATISLKDGGFKSGIKSAISNLGSFKKGSDSASSSVKKFGSQANSTGSSLASMAKKVAGAVAAYAGFNQVKEFVTDCVTGVMELERANTRLETLMMNVEGTTKAQVQELIGYADALELVTTIEGDATVAGASQLATFQLQSSTIKTLMPAFQDLAVAQYGVNVTQEQMIQSGNLIGKVMNGSVGALTKAGVSFTEQQEKILKTGTEAEKAATLVEVLNKNFGGLAQQMAQTDEGKIVQLKNAWGSVKDEVGFAVMPVISGAVNFLASRIPQIRDTVTTAMGYVSSGLTTIMNVGSAVFGAMKSGLTAVIDNWNWLGPIVYGVAGAIAAYNIAVGITNGLQAICAATTGASAAAMGAMSFSELAAATATGVLTAAQSALNAVFIASPIGWIVIGIVALIAAFVALWQNCEGFRNFFIGMWNKIKNAFSVVWNAIVSKLAPLKDAMVGAFQEAWAVIKIVWDFVAPYFNALWNTVKQYFNVVKVYISGAINTAWAIIKAVWDTVVGYFTAVWNTIKGIFSVVKNVLTGNWSGAWEAIKGIVSGWGAYFQGIWNSIKSVFAAVGSWFSSTFSAAWTAIKNIFATWGTFFSGLWNGIVSVFSGVASWFGGIFSSAWNMVVNAFSGVVGFFQGIWNTIKNMFTSIGTSIANGISGAFKSVINGVIGFAGRLINGFINSINFAIGIINKIPGVSISKLQTVNLPMLADGGNIRRPGDVIVGERGPEMLHLPKGASVEPLDRKGGKTENKFYINIDAKDKSPEEIVNELVPKLKLALEVL